jgi:hypothetical protein
MYIVKKIGDDSFSYFEVVIFTKTIRDEDKEITVVTAVANAEVDLSKNRSVDEVKKLILKDKNAVEITQEVYINLSEGVAEDNLKFCASLFK